MASGCCAIGWREVMRTLRIGEREVGPEQLCLVIAEAGVNHNGSLEMALRLVAIQKRLQCLHRVKQLCPIRRNAFALRLISIRSIGDRRRGRRMRSQNFPCLCNQLCRAIHILANRLSI